MYPRLIKSRSPVRSVLNVDTTRLRALLIASRMLPLASVNIFPCRSLSCVPLRNLAVCLIALVARLLALSLVYCLTISLSMFLTCAIFSLGDLKYASWSRSGGASRLNLDLYRDTDGVGAASRGLLI